MRVQFRHLAFLGAAAVAAAVVVSPAAGADPASCSTLQGDTACTTPGNSQINDSPNDGSGGAGGGAFGGPGGGFYQGPYPVPFEGN